MTRSSAVCSTLLSLTLGGCFNDPPAADADGSSSADAPETTSSSVAETTTAQVSTTVGDGGTDDEPGTTTGGRESTGGSDDVSSSSTSATDTTGSPRGCGDGMATGEERCDQQDLRGRSCDSFGFVDGDLACRDDCTLEFAGCTAPSGMVFIPPGPFTMGSMDHPDEQPVREVFLSPYFIDVHEVTAAAYTECMDASQCDAPMSTANPNYDDQCNVGQPGREEHPANCVGHHAATAFCSWADKRLPTEAEWEKAARGTNGRRYPWGDSPAPTCDRAIKGEGGAGCGEGSTAAVGSVPLGDSPYGAQDMAGNVWEWVSDYYAATYDGSATMDPTGPESTTDRVLRGGGWFQTNATEFTTSRRYDTNLVLSDAFIGFRCARPSPMMMP